MFNTGILTRRNGGQKRCFTDFMLRENEHVIVNFIVLLRIFAKGYYNLK